jgi:signal transduction histidine kinase/DNA-binding response OmpR family regulator/L-asparagine transporter-like permease
MKPKGLKPYLSIWGAVALAFGYAVGWGAFVMPGTMFLPGAGPLGTLLGFLIGAAVMAVIAWNYHTLVSRWPCSGGAFSYAQDSFGVDYGFLTAWFLLLAYVSILWANATALVLVGRYIMGDFLQVGMHYRVAGFDIYLGEVAFSIAVVLAVGAISIAGKRLAARTNFVLAALLVLGVAACFVKTLAHSGGNIAAMVPAFSPLKGASPAIQVMRVLAMIPWAFVGFEAISNSSAEFSFRPRRTFGVLLAAVVASTFVYVGLAFLPVLSLPDGYADWAAYIKARPSLAGVDAFPVLAATRRLLGAAGVPVFCVMIIGGIVTGIFGAIIATSRLLHSMAEEDVIPAWFGRLNKDGAPRNAMLAVIGISLLVPFFGRTAVGWPVDVSSIGAAIAYCIVSAAAFKGARTRGDSLTKVTGIAGIMLSVFFCILLLVPTYISGGVLAAESYLLLALWGLCGFFFYRHVFKHHRERYGHSSVVWVGVLVLIIFSSLMWVRQQTHSSIDGSVEEIRTFYKEARTSRRIPAVDDSAVMREVDFMASRMKRLGDEILEYDFVKFILLALALGLVFSIYRTQQWREKVMAIAKARADECNRAKTSFLSNMSHDIRTPMNAIIGYTELSKRPGVTEQTLREYMTKIEASSHHLLALVNDVLEMARIESGKMSLEPIPIDIVKTLDEVRDMFATQMSVKKIDFTVDASQVRDRHVMCDKNRLNRILLNLVSNAWKFTPDRGHVSIRAVQHGEVGANAAVYELRVKDTGIGMSQSFAARVFEAFEREQTSTVSRIQGSGLGMAITKSIVDLMKGEISVDTEQGKGTEFTVRLTLPFASPEDVAELGGAQSSATANAADFSSRRLLLVEDNPINREIATSLLRDAKFEVDEAENGRVAVEKMSQGGAGFYDAVLMDVQMPIMNGYEATRTIRAMDIPGISDVPIIALSANAFESDVRDSKTAGMNDHVAKPINIRELMSVLARHLGERGTGNGERGTGNGERGTGNGERGTAVTSVPRYPLPVTPSPKELLAALSEMGCDIKGTIDKTFMGNEAFYVKMFGKLPSNTAPRRMRTAFEAKDANGLFEASHELKGVYASLGLSPLYDLCSEIVEIARAGGLTGVDELLPQLEEMHAEIVKLANLDCHTGAESAKGKTA